MAVANGAAQHGLCGQLPDELVSPRHYELEAHRQNVKFDQSMGTWCGLSDNMPALSVISWILTKVVIFTSLRSIVRLFRGKLTD